MEWVGTIKSANITAAGIMVSVVFSNGTDRVVQSQLFPDNQDIQEWIKLQIVKFTDMEQRMQSTIAIVNKDFAVRDNEIADITAENPTQIVDPVEVKTIPLGPLGAGIT